MVRPDDIEMKKVPMSFIARKLSLLLLSGEEQFIKKQDWDGI